MKSGFVGRQVVFCLLGGLYWILKVIIFEAEAHLLTGIVVDWIELFKDFAEAVILEFLPGFGLMLD